mgnify:CR=1 FL=1
MGNILRNALFATDRFPSLLAVDCAGRPIHWVGWREAVRHYVLQQIAWTVGEPAAAVRGGISASGVRSMVSLHPVIALRGADGGVFEAYTPPVSNPALFARDEYRCMYCGEDLEHHKTLATRDHILPISRGGKNTWENLVTACRACNSRKDDRTPDEAGLRLLAVPYAPNYAEHLVLENRRILADQMAFLAKRVPRSRRRQ